MLPEMDAQSLKRLDQLETQSRECCANLEARLMARIRHLEQSQDILIRELACLRTAVSLGEEGRQALVRAERRGYFHDWTRPGHDT